ncbi:alpha/beta hydrolase family esterase [Mycolicibacterium aichiense]|uniref:extracellular catalytic domain type 1 short-chain-length polyhydroxyalkanoate depolymerase n=1 Tax=Mycolicibacterium aichiense TaxID=1799 RepID=UPI000E1C1755|nr:PHB depolymerase family esterase [Mycolicibacterium aichiense]MCV7017624.1 esterase [Mycolicibacterium aichiense]
MSRRRTALLAALFLLFAVPAEHASATGDPPGALTFGGVQRTYVLHVPDGLAHPNGLVINLHGGSQTGRKQSAETNYNAIADQYGWVVAYPNGIDFSWADGRGAAAPDRQGVDDVGFLAALIGRLTHDYNIPAGRVFVTGMSAGGFMANRLACERPDLVAAIAPVSSTLGVNVRCNPSKPVAVLAIHGTADKVVPYKGGRMIGRGGASTVVSAPTMVDRWLAFDRCPPATTTTIDGGKRLLAFGCADGTEVAFITINGWGHTWPVSPAAAFDASRASAEFFAAHGT